tara:strand:+ start:844 stop:1422 length:579 start_codon:yes stop_codon:yes gene_type:complete
MAKMMRRRGLSYTSQIPGYDANDNPLEDILPDRPPNTDVPIDPGLRPTPPADVPIDPGLGGGDGSGSPTGVDPILPDSPPDDPIPPVGEPLPPGGIPDDPILGPPGDEGRPSFRPHYMYDPVTGDAFYAATYEDHLRYEALGYVHTRPDTATGGDSGSGFSIFGGDKGDFVLIGLASMLFFGSIILGLRRGD